jgi:hypothetical protein
VGIVGILVQVYQDIQVQESQVILVQVYQAIVDIKVIQEM